MKERKILKINKRGEVGIKISRVEKFQKITNRGGGGGGGGAGDDYSEPESKSTKMIIHLVSTRKNSVLLFWKNYLYLFVQVIGMVFPNFASNINRL